MSRQRFVRRLVLAALLTPAIAAAPPQDPSTAADLQQRVVAKLREAGPGTRFGLVVALPDGQELVAISPDDRFIPASNTKIFTTAVAFDTMSGLDAPDAAAGALVRFEPGGRGAPDVVLEGRGDALLSSAPDCVANCLAALADAVAARTRVARDVIGDDRFFPDERWSQGMSWNNIVSRYGTATSALTLDHNELALRVSPSEPGRAPTIAIANYLAVDNRAVTTSAGETDLSVERLPGSSIVHLTGTIPAGAKTELIRLGIDDPAHYAAWRFKAMLEERGVRVKGAATSRHRLSIVAKYPGSGAGAPDLSAGDAAAIARLAPGPLGDAIRTLNKVSQNLHSELLLRRVGRQRGAGSVESGIDAVRSMLQRAAVPAHAFHLADGSGMSTYNRISPRGMVALLRWIAGRPWGSAWRATLPVGGVDGTLASRFKRSALQGRIFAKTGSLNATNALAGYMIARSGRTLVFAIYANDVPEDVKATTAMDSALELVALQN